MRTEGDVYHGTAYITGEEVFYVPRENFTIMPLPSGGTYSLMYHDIAGIVNEQKIQDIQANSVCKVKGLTPKVKVYVKGMSGEFVVIW